MPFNQIFYSCFWISAICIIWFYTDWFVYYAQLFGFAEKIRLDYASYLVNQPDKFFADYLYELSLTSDNKWIKFILKLISCPFCLIFWLSAAASIICDCLFLLAPVYVITLFIVFQIRKHV